VETKYGSDWYDAANDNLRCNSSIVETKCGTGWYNPATHYCKDGATLTQYGSVMDNSGKTYKTIAIGSQTWMAENLNYDVTDSRCYDDIESNCDTYGRLYDWATAMKIDAKYNAEKWGGSDVKHQGICPSGWHIPSNEDWTILATSAGGTGVYGDGGTAGTKLKAKSGWNDSGNGTDEFGFSALPGGACFGIYGMPSYVQFEGVGDLSYWRSSTESNSSYAYMHAYLRSMYSSANMLFYSGTGGFYNGYGKNNWHSVRCVQD
jgi:uncharacterized protein (TIGR02145 family)